MGITTGSTVERTVAPVRELVTVVRPPSVDGPANFFYSMDFGISEAPSVGMRVRKVIFIAATAAVAPLFITEYYGSNKVLHTKYFIMTKMKQTLLVWMASCFLLANARPVVRSIRSAHGETTLNRHGRWP